MEEYLTVRELSARIKMAPQTVYNKIASKKQQEFILGIHYIKPSPKKILFKWSEIEKWMSKKSQAIDYMKKSTDTTQSNDTQPTPMVTNSPNRTRQGLINI